MTLQEQASNYQDENKDIDLNSKSDNPPWINDSEDDSDDEWLFESMQRYKQLCTYSIVCEATSIDIHADSRQLVIAGERSLIANKANNQAMYEVAVYRIPEKLVIVDNEEKEGLSNGRDLSLLAGIGLERNVLMVRFLNSDVLVLAQKDDISIWSINTESDLLIKLKSVPLETPDLSVNIMTTSEDSMLLGFFRLSKMEIHELSIKWDAKKPQICEVTKSTETQIINAPKDLLFEKFESFNQDLVTILSTNMSMERNFLFFEPHYNSENNISLEYLGGIVDVDTTLPNYKLLVSSWTYMKQDGVLGATIRIENSDEEARHLFLHIYHSKTLDKKSIRSNMCSQKIQLHSNEDLVCHGNIDVLRNNVSVHLVPSSNSVMSTICDTDERPSKLFAYTLVVKIEAKVNLYQMNFHVLGKTEDSKAWRVDCNLLFCHDAHKSRILHALQYSSKLPQLFISVDENKELHAWHWQNNDKSKKI